MPIKEIRLRRIEESRGPVNYLLQRIGLGYGTPSIRYQAGISFDLESIEDSCPREEIINLNAALQEAGPETDQDAATFVLDYLEKKGIELGEEKITLSYEND